MNDSKHDQSMPLPIYWSDRAKADLVDIGDFIARDNPNAALVWVEKLLLAVEKTADMPFSWRIVPEFRAA